jgi:hypothetical protein
VGFDTGRSVETGGYNPGQNVATNEAGEAGEEGDARRTASGPGEIARGERASFRVSGVERDMSERFDVQSAEEVVHDGVAGKQDFANGTAGGEFLDHRAERLADGAREDAGVAQFEADAAHQVGAVTALRVESGSDVEDFAGGQIEKLSSQGRGANVDGDAKSFGGFEGKRRVVGEDGRVPLINIQRDGTHRMRAAGEAPAVAQFFGGERLRHFGGDGNIAGDDTDAAAAAEHGAAARELHAAFEEDVFERAVTWSVDAKERTGRTGRPPRTGGPSHFVLSSFRG